MNALTLVMLSGLFCGVPALLVFTWAICRAARDTRTVDDGRAFGGDND